MDRNESKQWISEHTTDAQQAANGAHPHSDRAHPAESSVAEKQNGLYEELHEEVERLLLEVDRVRDQQQALQRSPQSNDIHADNDAEEEDSDDSNTKHLADGGGDRHRRPVRLILALLVAAILCVGSLYFWRYMQSYEATDDAEIDGHLDPLSTRIDGTVVNVYVEDTYQVKQGQALVDLDPRDNKVAVENAVANLVQAEQGVHAAQQNYALSVANLAATVATNAKAQVDVARSRTLKASGDCARDRRRHRHDRQGRCSRSQLGPRGRRRQGEDDWPGRGRGPGRASLAGSGQA
jgi:acetyl/propionyl-CoA carboxylase alpha subunit